MSQKYEKLVEEDLNVGTEPTWICCPGSGELRATQVGIHSVARGQRAYTSTWAPGAIAAGLSATTTISVKDAYLKDFVMVSHDKILTSALRISGHVSAADTVKVVIHNPTAASITVASGTLRVIVFPQCSAQATAASAPEPVPATQDVTFTPTVTLGTPPYTYLWDFGTGLPAIEMTDLYGYWPLDETSGSTRVCTLGAGPDLLEVGGAVADTTGRFGNAASSTEADTSALSATLVPPLAVSAGLTIAFWFQWPAYSSASPKTMLALSNAPWGVTPPTLMVYRYYGSDYLDVYFAWSAGNAIALPVTKLGNFEVGTWHLLVVTYDPSTGTLTGRVDDGCMSSSQLWTGVPLPCDKLESIVPGVSLAAANTSTFDTLRILKAIAGGNVNFEGEIDDLRIWSTVLTDEQIADLWYRSDEEIPTYRYAEAGTQTATVTVTDATGCTASDTVDVTVGAEFSVSVTAEPDWENGADGEMYVKFTYTITGGTAPFTYSLSWTGGGGGGPNTSDSPTITFTGIPLAPETIPWALTVTDDNLFVAYASGSVDVVYQD